MPPTGEWYAFPVFGTTSLPSGHAKRDCTLDLGEGVAEVGDQVFDVFDANGEPY